MEPARRFDLYEIYGVFTRKSPENVEFRDFLMEISGIELLLFVCLKDSQDKEKPPKSEDFEGFWWR